MHWRAVDKWIYPGIGLWAGDRLFRILRLVVLNKLYTVKPYLSPTASNLPSTATLTLLTPSTLKVSFPAPASLMKWSAGQHFYVVMPGMARLPWEAHPFTAATVPAQSQSSGDSGELTFIVRVRDGFTKRMKDRVDAERKAQGLGVEEECQIKVKAAVEGPYGHVRKLDLYDGVVVVAGMSRDPVPLNRPSPSSLRGESDVGRGRADTRCRWIRYLIRRRPSPAGHPGRQSWSTASAVLHHRVDGQVEM